MGWMLGTIARAYVAVLADVAGDHPLGQASPSRVRVEDEEHHEHERERGSGPNPG
jgi:hypothetical protein